MLQAKTRRAGVLAPMAALILVAAGCSAGGQTSTQPTAEPYLPIMVSTDLAVGPNRFMLGLVGPDRSGLVADAGVHLRFWNVRDGDARPRIEMAAVPVTVEKNLTHVHDDGKIETHPTGTVGIYLAQVDFAAPGDWRFEITGKTKDGKSIPPTGRVFVVQERSRSVPIGSPAPRSIHLTLKDVKELSEIDTSDPPDPQMHGLTVAAAVDAGVLSGKPTVIVIATPGFCHSQVCGPTKDAVDELFLSYGDRTNFVHVEPYDLPRLREKGQFVPVKVMEEWGLQTEPWVFIVDREGKVAAKFEGIVLARELEAALVPLLTGS